MTFGSSSLGFFDTPKNDKMSGMLKTKKISLSVFSAMLRDTKRITGIIWKERKGLVIGLIFILILLSFLPFLSSGAVGLLINELVRVAGNNKITNGLLLFGILFASASFLIPFFRTVQLYFANQLRFFLQEKLEILIVSKKGEIDIAVHEDPVHNDLFNKVREGGLFRLESFVDRQFFIFQNALEVMAASVILIFAEWWVFLIIFVGTIPSLIVEAKYGRDVWGIYTAKAEVRRKFWNLKDHFETVPYLIELKIFKNIAYFVKAIKELFRDFIDEEKRNEKKKLFNELLVLVLSQAVSIFAIVWFVLEVVQGNLQIGTLTFFLASIGGLEKSLGGLFSNLGRQYQDGLFVRDVFKLLDIEPVIPKHEKGVVINPNRTPEIVFDNVSFSYPKTKKLVLKNFSMKIASGEKVALVGINGAGKTTLIKLLCRFYDTSSGKILLDGHDIKNIDLESWYHVLGAIFQDYGKYYFTVKDLIALGRVGEDKTMPKVKRAAQASGADVFIEEWEETYNQMLGKHFSEGVEPSIGQWQKLALAKAFYRDSRILILDEPTSSIDAEAEAKIFDKLESLPSDRTVILISHRFSTVRHADRICVIENGKAKEIGTHKELLALGGLYARLFRLQAKGYQ